MSEENKMDQSTVSQPVEDVFSGVEEANDFSAIPTSQETAQENVNISESSIGKEDLVAPIQGDKIIVEPQTYQGIEKGNKGINTGKILFYLILVLIVLLGAFAIWALVS